MGRTIHAPRAPSTVRAGEFAIDVIHVLWYIRTMKDIERVQTGVRIEKRLLKVLKGLAEYLDLSLGDLLEGVVLHAFEGRPPFGEATIAKIAQLKQIYGLDLIAADSHKLRETNDGDG
jgi:hypothetical protein